MHQKTKEADKLAHVNIVNMEVWKCKSFTLRGVHKDGIDNLIGRLKFSSNKDSDGQQPAHWDLVIDLQLQECEPLVVRVQCKAKCKHKGTTVQEDLFRQLGNPEQTFATAP
ncbi:hypothetical protein F5888DRAFT_1635744 [Russula emetica]|nr:hypothetical protein F5888DRAFT_1635744 [Russula emetica]